MKFISYGIRGSKSTPLKKEDISTLITSFLLSLDREKLAQKLKDYAVFHQQNNTVAQEKEAFNTFNDFISQKLEEEPLTIFNVASDTPCVEVALKNTDSMKGQQILFDLGTGASHVKILPDTKTIHVFFSHFHYDHIQGILFFKELYDRHIQVHFYSPIKGFKRYLHGLMSYPYFPVTMEDSMPHIIFHELEKKKSITINNMKITWMGISHPGGSYAYRVDHRNKSFCYFSDVNITENLFKKTKENVAFLTGIDSMVLDATMSFADIVPKANFGHSSFYAGVDFVNFWDIKNTYLFHLDPSDDIRTIAILYQSMKWYNMLYDSSNNISLSQEIEWIDV